MVQVQHASIMGGGGAGEEEEGREMEKKQQEGRKMNNGGSWIPRDKDADLSSLKQPLGSAA